MICKNCFNEIIDARKEVKCTICNSHLHKDCSIKEDNKFFCDNCYTVKLEDKPNDLNYEVPEIIRRSYIETYKSCPYKFLLEIIKGIKDEDDNSIYAKIGIDLHKLFEKACNDSNYKIKHMATDFISMWHNYTTDMFINEEQKNSLLNRSLISMNSFYNVLANMPQKPHSTEDTIIFSVGENLPKVSTTSDRIDLIDGELEMSDWKTGKVMVGKKISSDLQAPLYIYGARQKYNLPIRKFTFYYLSENKTRTFERITNDDYVCWVKKRKYIINITDAIREVQVIMNQIKKGNFNIPQKTTGMYFTCKMCNLQKNGHCRGADLESWHLAQER